MKYRFKYNKSASGYEAYQEHYPVFTMGENLTQLKENALEAIQLYFEVDNISIDQILLIRQ